MTAAYGWSLCSSHSAVAQTRDIVVPAGTLAEAIAILSRQTGATIGASGPLPTIRVNEIGGRMDAGRALSRLLKGTGWRAVKVVPGVFRLSPAPKPSASPRRTATPTPSPTPIAEGEVVVTANKRIERIRDSAAALEVVDAATLGLTGDAPGTAAAASLLNGLTVTNLGTGRDRLFVRGIADSPFDGFGQSSVAVHIGEARATYDAPDPDLRLIDVARVELLKGPQGPLYGTGALGGVFRIVPNAPALDMASAVVGGGASFTASGRAAGNVDGVVNLPLVRDRVALRVVGYRIGLGGWIDQGSAPDINRGTTTGGRVGIGAQLGRWRIEATALSQASRVADSQYVEQRDSLSRTARLREPQDTDFALLSATATGPIAGITATISASTARQELNATYDASTKAPLLGGSAAAQFNDRRKYGVTTGEFRLSNSGRTFDWLAGASLLIADTNTNGTLVGPGGKRPVLQFDRDVTEAAVFGELTAHAMPVLDASLGVRVFRSDVRDERSDTRGAGTEAQDRLHVSPSATLAWRPGGTWQAYARASSAIRPGGIQSDAAGTVARYRSDRLDSVEFGWRYGRARGSLTVDANLFASRWRDVQADFLGLDGLVTTRNAGSAHDHGLDVSADWRPVPRLHLGGGVVLQRARIDAAAGGQPDRRLPVVPDIAGRLSLGYAFPLGGWQWQANARGNFIGERRLSFDPGLDRESEAAATLALSLSATRGPWRWQANLENAGNSRADTFAFGNPFTIAASQQHTPLRPRTLTLTVHRSW